MEKRKGSQIADSIPERSNFKCLAPGCKKDNNGGARGLCTNHYSALAFSVKVGKNTWEQLEKEGRSRPKLTSAERGFISSKKNPFKRVWSSTLKQFYFTRKG